MAYPYHIAALFVKLAKGSVFKLEDRENSPGLQLKLTGKVKNLIGF